MPGAIPAASVSSLIITIAARWSAEITPLAYSSNGEVTSSTPSSAAKRSTLVSMAVRIAGSRTDSPAGATRINCAVVPLAWGNVRPSESSAVCDSVPGSVNSSSKSPPISAAAPPRTSSVVSQASRTASRRRYAARPSPYRNDDT